MRHFATQEESWRAGSSVVNAMRHLVTQEESYMIFFPSLYEAKNIFEVKTPSGRSLLSGLDRLPLSGEVDAFARVAKIPKFLALYSCNHGLIG
jgi:hypothetical protein